MNHIEAFNEIVKIEKKFSLHSLKLKNVYPWSYLRFSYFRKLQNQKISKYSGKINYSAIVTSFISIILSKRTKYIAFSFPSAYKNTRNGYINIYFSPLLKNNDISIFHEYNNLKSFNNDRVVGEINGYLHLFLSKLIKRFVDNPSINEINKEVINCFSSLNIDLQSSVRDFISAKIAYKIILFIRKPKKILIQDGYSQRHRALVVACKEMNIDTIEIQHGIISKYHPGYIFGFDRAPQEFINKHIPDKLLIFGIPTQKTLKGNSYWSKENIILFGSPLIFYYRRLMKNKDYIDSVLNKILKRRERGKTIILFTSQGVKRDECRDFVRSLSKVLDDSYLILYKPHPIESDYCDFYKTLRGRNIKILSNKSFLYDLLLISDIHTSYYSTCIYETIEFGITNILIKDNDSENIIGVENLKGVYFVKDVDEYMQTLNIGLEKTRAGYYFVDKNTGLDRVLSQ